MNGPPDASAPEGSDLQEVPTSSGPPVTSANAGGFLAACVVVFAVVAVANWASGRSSPSPRDALRDVLPSWAVISLVSLAFRRRLAPLLGAAGPEAWAAAFAGVLVTVAATEFYFFRLLQGVPLEPAWKAGVGELALYCLAVGLFEELGFRGVVLEGLAGVFSRPVAHVLTILSFAFIHFRPLVGWPPLLLFGLIFGLLREYGRSLWPCVAGHALVDFLFFSRWAP